MRRYFLNFVLEVEENCSNIDIFGMCSICDCLSCPNADYELVDEFGNVIKPYTKTIDLNFCGKLKLSAELQLYDDVSSFNENNVLKIMSDPDLEHIYQSGKIINLLRTKYYVRNGDLVVTSGKTFLTYKVFKIDRSDIDINKDRIFNLIKNFNSNESLFDEFDEKELEEIALYHMDYETSILTIDLSKIKSLSGKLVLFKKRILPKK